MPVKKDEKKKTKKKSKKEGNSDPEVEVAPAVIETKTIPVETLFEASQLFLRYDRSRSGLLNKQDFLQLIDDLNSRNKWGQKGKALLRPFTLTDWPGIPLGFERTGKNTQFEAGQLFERYDPQHTGTISTEAFQRFYNDFKTQLSPYFHQLYLENDMMPSSSAYSSSGREDKIEQDGTASLRDLYQSRLSRMQSVIKYSFHDKQQLMLDRITDIQKEIQQVQTNSRKGLSTTDVPRTEDVMYMSMLREELDELRRDLDQMDRLCNDIKMKTLHDHVSVPEMRQFTEEYSTMFEFAEKMAQKIIRVSNTAATTKSTTAVSLQKYEEAVKMLKVKDQVIWELLQERDSLRKKNNAMELDVKELSKISTEEMQEWAQLTDEMANELQNLRYGQTTK